MTVITLHTDKPVTAAGLIWENPPERSTAGKYAAVAQALRENPNQWAVVRTFDAHHRSQGWRFSNTINSGTKLADFRANRDGHFKALCRTANGETRVYVRWLPTAIQALA